MSKKTRVPLGITSMSYWYYKVEDAVPLAADTGYDAMEVWTEHVWKFQERASKVGSVLASNKLRCTLHCPVMDTNITSPNPGIREESVRQFIQAVEMAHDLGAELMVIHPGHLYSVNETLDEFWGRLVESFERIMTQAQKRNVRLAVENMDVQKEMEVIKWSEDVKRLRKHFEKENLGIVMDTTHLSSVPQILRFIQDTGVISHMHLSDAKITPQGAVATHLPVGEGELDFKQVFNGLLPHFHGIVSFETFLPPTRSQTLLTQREWLDGIVNSN